MLYVLDDGTIKLTRGDTARIAITINNLLNQEYSIGKEDSLTLTIKKKVKDIEPLLQKIVKGTTLFHIKPEDTNDFSFGKYVYDVQLTLSNGDVYTIIEPSSFVILSEVTC